MKFLIFILLCIDGMIIGSVWSHTLKVLVRCSYLWIKAFWLVVSTLGVIFVIKLDDFRYSLLDYKDFRVLLIPIIIYIIYLIILKILTKNKS